MAKNSKTSIFQRQNSQKQNGFPGRQRMRIMTSRTPYKTSERSGDRTQARRTHTSEDIYRVFHFLEMKSHGFVLVMCFCYLASVDSSAIPMWEFLSKEEKMSYLYSMFANQVDQFCGKSTMANCNKELLKYGLGKLKDMPEDHLDVMDPYQRGANDIIWDSMMEGHEMMKTSNPRGPTTYKPNSYEDESFGDYGAASAKIDNVYRVSPPKGFVYTIQSGTPQYTYPTQNKNGAYTRFQQLYSTTGKPFEVKVYPDGRPVREGTSQAPHDEDYRQYQLSKVKIPSL